MNAQKKRKLKTVVLGLGAVAALGAAVYYLTRPKTAAPAQVAPQLPGSSNALPNPPPPPQKPGIWAALPALNLSQIAGGGTSASDGSSPNSAIGKFLGW